MKGARAAKGGPLALARKLVEEYGEQLLDEQREAFADMLAKGRALTEKQAAWVAQVAERLGIDPSKNMFSALPIDEQAEHRRNVTTALPWERGEMPRPLKPPGRS